MKKKWICLIGTFAVLTVALAGCGGDTVYSQLNTLSAKDYESVTLELTTVTDGETLTGTYAAEQQDDGIKITYTYQQVNAYKVGEDGTYIVPAERVSTLSGTMVVNGEEIVSRNGADVNLSYTAITASGLTFAETFFENAEETDGGFQADVVNPAAFLGTQLTCTGMKVKVQYTADSLTKLTVTYVSAQKSTVTMVYTFG